jgi:hypothetical protein
MRGGERRISRVVRLRSCRSLNGPAAVLNYWKNPPPGAMVFDNSALEDSPLLGPKAILKDFPAADRLWREDIDPDADLLP